MALALKALKRRVKKNIQKTGARRAPFLMPAFMAVFIISLSFGVPLRLQSSIARQI